MTCSVSTASRTCGGRSVSGSRPSSLYAASSLATLVGGLGSSNCLTRNSRTCSLTRASSFGGRLNLSPVAALDAAARPRRPRARTAVAGRLVLAAAAPARPAAQRANATRATMQFVSHSTLRPVIRPTTRATSWPRTTIPPRAAAARARVAARQRVRASSRRRRGRRGRRPFAVGTGALSAAAGPAHPGRTRPRARRRSARGPRCRRAPCGRSARRRCVLVAERALARRSAALGESARGAARDQLPRHAASTAPSPACARTLRRARRSPCPGRMRSVT